jgi:hypothetical protein
MGSLGMKEGLMGGVPSVSARRALRRAVELPCELVSSYLDEPLLYWATDLTPHGMWLDTSFPMLAGEVVAVCFEPAIWWSRRPLCVFAEVIRSTRGRTAGMALSFLDMTPHEQRALNGWLRGRPPPLPRRRPRTATRRMLPIPRSDLEH